MRALGLVVATASIARADAPVPQLAALAPASDARQAIAIGPAGEIYQPDTKGEWVHRPGVAIAGKVASATRAGDSVVATTHDGPPFRLARDGWTVVQLGMHVKPIVGAGPRVLAAAGRAVFELDKPEPAKLPDAPAPVLALAASTAGAVVETERGLFELKGTAWKPLAKAPPRIVTLLSDRLALVERGLYDLRTTKTLALPPGLQVAAAIATGEDGAVVLAHKGSALELVTARAGKLMLDPLPAGATGPVAGMVADRAGRVVVAFRDGRLAVRDRGTWSTVRVRDDASAAHPGPPPATSR